MSLAPFSLLQTYGMAGWHSFVTSKLELSLEVEMNIIFIFLNFYVLNKAVLCAQRCLGYLAVIWACFISNIKIQKNGRLFK